MSALSIFCLVLGTYLLIHNEWLLHDNNLKKNFEVISWRCFAGGFLIAVGAALWVL